MMNNTKSLMLLILVSFFCFSCTREIDLKLKGWKKKGEMKLETLSVSSEQFGKTKEEMISEFEKEYGENPSGYNASELGMLLWNCNGNNERALALIDKSLEMESDDFQVLLNAADVFSRCNKNEKKVDEILEKVNRVESQSDTTDSYKAEVFFGVGTIYERIKEFKKASIFYAKALSLQPDDIFLHSGKTYVVKNGLNKEYKDSLKRVLEKLKNP